MENVRFSDGDILEAGAPCVPVNLAGAMGRGLALQAARRWPAIVPAYRAMLRSGELGEGTIALWRHADGWVLLAPTKRHWRNPSPPELVEATIAAIGPACLRRGISEVAVPPLGCGLGGLEAARVLPLVLEAAARRPGIRWTLCRWPARARAAAERRPAGRPNVLG